MQQYEFAVAAKNGAKYTVFCTSQDAHKAFAAVSACYSGLTVLPEPLSIRAPHYVYGEVDATA